MQQKLQDDLKHALKSGDKIRVAVLRMVMTGVKNAEIDQKAPLSDGDVLAVFAKEAKRRKESIEAFEKGNRQDLADQEKAELAILQEYLPQQMSRDEIAVEARKVISEIGASSQKDKGKVMSKLVNQLKGKAEGQQINEVVSELLAGLEQ
ncbi:MAG: GatB/YqeY domain-containing protein [Chloroflexota bacterium]|nr:GatB/YqeY domain-containing protein [Chloroflexota bacterium]